MRSDDRPLRVLQERPIVRSDGAVLRSVQSRSQPVQGMPRPLGVSGGKALLRRARAGVRGNALNRYVPQPTLVGPVAKSAKSMCVSAVEAQVVSLPPKNVEKKTPSI